MESCRVPNRYVQLARLMNLLAHLFPQAQYAVEVSHSVPVVYPPSRPSLI